MEGKAQTLQKHRAFESLHAGPNQSFRYRAGARGWYDVEVKVVAPGAGAYSLRITKTP